MGLKMAPWDELKYFALPTEASFGSAQPTNSPVAKFDPMRVLLILSVGNPNGFVNISTKTGPTSNTTLLLTTANTLIFTAKDHPMLCQGEWYTTISGTNILVVTSVTMNKWPRKDLNGYPFNNPGSTQGSEQPDDY